MHTMHPIQTPRREARSRARVFWKMCTASFLAAAGLALLPESARAQIQGAGNFSAQTATGGSNWISLSSHGPLPAVDASFFGTAPSSKDLEKTGYLGDLGYQSLMDAENCPGAYSCIRCDFRWYFNGDLVGFRREGNRRFSLTASQLMNDVEFELGTRATIGRMCDCSTAYEFVYVGPFYWTRNSVTLGADNVQSRFFAIPASLDDAFNDADEHRQSLLMRASSFELNRRKWAWDAVSTLIGIRYINYDEKYALASQRSAPFTDALQGRYSDEISNHLIGPQIGGDVFFVTTLKTSISLRGKLGVFGNFAERDVRLVEDGTTIFFNGDDKVDWSGLLELGIFGNYQITPSIRLSGGYELWYMPGIASVPRQNPAILTSVSGSTIRLREDLFLHGFNGGVQILY